MCRSPHRLVAKMKPIRYVAYGVSTLLIIVGVCLMTREKGLGFLVMMSGVCCSPIGKPRKKQSFFPLTKKEVIRGILMITGVSLFFLLILSTDSGNRSNSPYSLVQASIAGILLVLIIAWKFLRERKIDSK